MQPFCVRDLADLVDQLQVGREALAVEAREVRRAARVALLQRRLRRDRAGEEAAAERGVGDQADAELADRREDLVLEVAGEQRVLASAAR